MVVHLAGIVVEGDQQLAVVVQLAVLGILSSSSRAGEVWLTTKSIITLMSCACATATRRLKSAIVPNARLGRLRSRGQ
jgi:hypothetical protein